MKVKSRILIILLLFAIILSVTGVSASEINETSQAVVDDGQDEAVSASDDVNEVLQASADNASDGEVLQVSADNACDNPVLKASCDNASEQMLAMAISSDSNVTVVVNGTAKVVVPAKAISSEPVLKSSGKIKKVTIKSKYNKYVTKKVGKYKVQVYKWKGYRLGGLNIYLFKNGKYVKRSAFVTRAYFKMNGRWRWSSWSHASSGYTTYHHYPVSNNVKITKVQVKFRYR